MSGGDDGAASPDGRRRLAFALVPVLVFAVLAGFFLIALRSGDPSDIPSALIGKPVPRTELAALDDLTRDGAAVPGIDMALITSPGIKVVNVWASWCAPCRVEHPLLMKLAENDGIRMLGINYKDEPENARRFLGVLGNPYEAVGVDGTGRTAVDWGVYGVPETFIVDGRGHIVHKHVGPLTEAVVAEDILPVIAKAARQP